MAQANSASSNAGSYARCAKDERLLDLRRLVVETEEAIVKSRAMIRSTRDAIELLDRLQGRRVSSFPCD
jgi:hypothetical protein